MGDPGTSRSGGRASRLSDSDARKARAPASRIGLRGLLLPPFLFERREGKGWGTQGLAVQGDALRAKIWFHCPNCIGLGVIRVAGV